MSFEDFLFLALVAILFNGAEPLLFYDHINTIYQFIKSFLEKKKCLFLRNMASLRCPNILGKYSMPGLITVLQLRSQQICQNQ